MKYAIVTFGCRVNQADSFALEAQLLASGACPGSPDEADLVVVNTCSVTAAADQGGRQTIRRINRINPSARVVVTGCYATRAPQDVSALPGVVRVVPNDQKADLLPVIAAGLSTAERFGSGDGSCGAVIEPGVAGRTAFTLRVQTGCSEPCSYCIIPSTRGQPRSVPIDGVLDDVRRAEAAGFKEIVLTGVHLGSYGRDLTPRRSLFDLLSRLPAHVEDVRFRISSLEPMDCTSEIAALVAERREFAAHFHLPLQHASDRLLTKMRRPYTLEQYAGLVDGLRRDIPHASIGSDVIVGFPGETENDAAFLTSYLSGSPLTHVHVFPYSDRPGTAASTFRGKVPGGAVRERARRVREIGASLSSRFHESQVGTVHRALTLESGTVALTGNYLKLNIPAGRMRNEWVTLKVTSHHDGELLRG